MEDKLPENVTFDIFSRLPIKTIISCRRVCKKWRSLVADPYFAHLHLSRSRQQALIILDCPCPDVLCSNSNFKPGTLYWLEIEHEHQHLYTVKSLNLKQRDCIGSVNGLVSYLGNNSDDNICIINPVLEEYLTLPLPPPRSHFITIGYGFGVSTAGEYKAIRVYLKTASINPSETAFWPAEIEVYTLGTDQWRALRETPKLGWLLGPSVCLDGHLYWLANRAQIYDFDLSSETSEVFPSPPPPLDSSESGMMLGVLKGRLYCVCWGFTGGVEVWVMKEESGNWYKEMTAVRPFVELGAWKPWCLIDDLEEGTRVLLVYVRVTNKLVAYCLDTKRIRSETSIFLGRLSFIMTYRPGFVKLDQFGSQRVHAMYNHNPQAIMG